MNMKTNFMIIALMAATAAFSREQTLIGGDIEHGGFGGVELKISPIGRDNTNAVLMGGRGGWIINHTFVLGGGGYGLVSDIPADWVEERWYEGEAQPYYLNFGYGGLLLAYIHNSDALLHYELWSIIGGGAVDVRTRADVGEMYSHMSGDGVFVAEPGINIMLNVTPFLRIGAGASYRYVAGVNDPRLTNEDLTNFSGQIILKFGAF